MAPPELVVKKKHVSAFKAPPKIPEMVVATATPKIAVAQVPPVVRHAEKDWESTHYSTVDVPGDFFEDDDPKQPKVAASVNRTGDTERTGTFEDDNMFLGLKDIFADLDFAP